MKRPQRLPVFFAALAVYAASFGALAGGLDDLHRLFALGLALPLVWLTADDAARLLIPDGASGAVAGLGLAHLACRTADPVALALAAAAALTALAFFWLLGTLYWQRRGVDGLGIGDAKLMGAAVAVVGLADFWRVLLLAALGGMVALALARRRGHPGAYGIPFGPFLAYAIFLTFLLRTP